MKKKTNKSPLDKFIQQYSVKLIHRREKYATVPPDIVKSVFTRIINNHPIKDIKDSIVINYDREHYYNENKDLDHRFEIVLDTDYDYETSWGNDAPVTVVIYEVYSSLPTCKEIENATREFERKLKSYETMKGELSQYME
jgi:hypothetical protein